VVIHQVSSSVMLRAKFHQINRRACGRALHNITSKAT